MKRLKFLLVKLGVLNPPKCLQLLLSAPYRAGTQKRQAAMASKALELLYWYEVFNPKNVFKREKEDSEFPEKRLFTMLSILDGCIDFGASMDKINEVKALLMFFSCKSAVDGIFIQKIIAKQNIEFKTFNDIVTKNQAARGFWNG